jgi:hypothetical protein
MIRLHYAYNNDDDDDNNNNNKYNEYITPKINYLIPLKSVVDIIQTDMLDIK